MNLASNEIFLELYEKSSHSFIFDMLVLLSSPIIKHTHLILEEWTYSTYLVLLSLQFSNTVHTTNNKIITYLLF